MALVNPINKSECLEHICASNYRKLFRLIPDLLIYRSQAVGFTANHSDLHVGVIDRSPYTMTVQMSYRFNKNLAEFLEPAVRIRLYLDAGLAEVISDHSRSAVSTVFKDPGDSHGIMNYKWRLNYFLHKWLDHCLNKNYQFMEESLASETIAADNEILI
ncbi:MAG: DUF1249 domain-containing protein [Gammaproteobacteria bacterium]